MFSYIIIFEYRVSHSSICMFFTYRLLKMIQFLIKKWRKVVGFIEIRTGFWKSSFWGSLRTTIPWPGSWLTLLHELMKNRFENGRFFTFWVVTKASESKRFLADSDYAKKEGQKREAFSDREHFTITCFWKRSFLAIVFLRTPFFHTTGP